ncbi:RNA-directed DNA polymerase [Salegentibacter agarivorans]
MKLNRKHIDAAYRKLKSYIYYDNFSLLTRQELAHFESADGLNNSLNFEQRLDKLTGFLRSPNIDDIYFKNLLEEIDCWTAPKSFEELSNFKEPGLVISNNFSDSEYRLEKVNYFINCPIEIHIISILWILNEGYTLQKLYNKNNYAYQLELNEESGEVVDGLRLFKPYFMQYPKWRDNGIETAKEVTEKDTDVVILSLDIKEYYYNIGIDDNVKKDLKYIISKNNKGKGTKLTDILFAIMRVYAQKCPKNKGNILPIGLLSSGILANWYLHSFDELIKKELAPAYYGRYVDDIQIVLANSKLEKKFDQKYSSSVEAFFEKYFVDRNIFKAPENVSFKNKKYKYINDPNIEIQGEKILFYAFESKESQAVLDMFRKKIEQNSSAFWFLPANGDINEDFDQSVYELTYSDTINKLRSVTDIKQSKYGAAVFLAKKIKVTLLSGKKKDEKTADQILTFFKGLISLEFSSIWEKALTYFVITNDRDSFWKFFSEVSRNIEKIVPGENQSKESVGQVKLYLTQYLINCSALSTALNSEFLTAEWWENKKEKITGNSLKKSFDNEINAIRKAYVNSNLFRNGFISIPLLNYTNIISESKNNINFIDHQFLRKNKVDVLSLELDLNKLKYAPRYVYFYEFNLLENLKHLISVASNDVNFTEDDENTILSKSFRNFFETNYTIRLIKKRKEIADFEESLRNYYFKIEDEISDPIKKISTKKIIIPQSNKNLKNFKVAVANTVVQEDNIVKSLFEKPNESNDRRDDLIDILNASEKSKTDALILPEVSVPYPWLPQLTDEARRKQRMIIMGLEHITINNKAFNYLVTCLPIKHNGIKDCIVSLRLKNHYSPAEQNLIWSKGREIPKVTPYYYEQFVWRGVHFSCYNCYELADIEHRALFKGKIDILFASEYNRDINYFSNIAESVSRDVHCAFIQSNSSQFGDSRITIPKKTALKDILRLKGGINSVVLVGKLDIVELREFQSTLVQFQNTDKYKNTPPNFNHRGAEER